MGEHTRILISGGGVGGLTLAHALRGAGLDVAAYENVMLPRGIATVDSSLEMAGRLFGNLDRGNQSG